MTAAGRLRSAAVVVLVLGLSASPAAAHPGEGQTPYRYVVAPPGVISEGAATSGVSIQPIGPAGFAGTTDNQMQLTLPAGAFAPRSGAVGVRVQLDQLDPATLPPLPEGLEAEGNGYRVRLTYAPSGAALVALTAPAVLSVSAPAGPTDVLQLVDGRWQRRTYTPVVAEADFGSVVQLEGPITLLQVYNPTNAPPSKPSDSAQPLASPPDSLASGRHVEHTGPGVVVLLTATVVALVGIGGCLLMRRRRRGTLRGHGH